MKKFFNLFLLGTATMFFAACSSNTPEERNGEKAQAAFTINVTNTTDVSATVEVLPVDTTRMYMLSYMETEEFNESKYTDSVFAMEDDLAYWVEYYNYYKSYFEEEDISFAEYFLMKGNQELTAKELQPSTSYTVYVYHIDITETDTVLSGYTYTTFTTKQGVQTATTFKFNYDDEGNMTITPSDNSDYWFAMIDNETLYDEEEGYAGDLKEALIDDYESTLFWASFMGEEDVELFSGEYTFYVGDYAWVAGKHTVIAAGFNGNYITTDIATKEIEITEDMVPDDDDYDYDEDDDYFAPRNKKKALANKQPQPKRFAR